ncbi:hypothetical protein ACTVZO_11980 [Streptomyces sp. IBSNAI002]|uniref:hypothetical protein n=1 Tax=Streptomyces sp. IBSNAI002 TaxID=3457500 RepID=UPI003FD5A23A
MYITFPAGDDYRPAIETGRCVHCAGLIRWVACPTGGWWAHERHPVDGHDAEADA